MKTKSQILDRLQELDQLHEFTPAQQAEYNRLEDSFPEAPTDYIKEA